MQMGCVSAHTQIHTLVYICMTVCMYLFVYLCMCVVYVYMGGCTLVCMWKPEEDN